MRGLGVNINNNANDLNGIANFLKGQKNPEHCQKKLLKLFLNFMKNEKENFQPCYLELLI